MNEIVIFLSLGLVVLWTMRMAKTKGRNPFLWGGLALGLMLIPSWPALLGMAPMIILLFIKNPQVAAQEVSQDTVNCPKCRAVHAAGHTYCVNCGWELAKPYGEEGIREEHRRDEPRIEEPPREEPRRPREQPAGPPVASGPPSAGSSPPTAPASRPVELPPTLAEVTPAAAPPGPKEEAPAAPGSGEETRADGPTQEAAAAPPPFYRRPITPESFTERGMALLDLGKLQEAVDQFTKALALNPGHIPAWEQRAETYVRLGQERKAQEDRRHLAALREQESG